MADDLLTDNSPGGAAQHNPVPPECDVFTLNPEKLEKMLARGIDAHIRRVRIYRTTNGQKQRVPGEFDVGEVNTARVLKRYGPGRYEFQGLNENGQFLASSTHNLVHGFEEEDEGDEVEDEYLPEMPPAPQLPSNIDPMLAFMMQQQHQSNQLLMQVVIASISANKGGGQSELAEAIAASSAASMQGINSVTNAMAANFAAQAQSPAAQGAAQTNSTLEKIVLQLMAKDREPSQQSAQQNASELLLVLSQLKEQDEGGSKLFWTEIFPTLIDGLGAPVLGAVAAAMPADKGAILSELLQQHMRTREAEAKAEAGPDPIETDGVGI